MSNDKFRYGGAGAVGDLVRQGGDVSGSLTNAEIGRIGPGFWSDMVRMGGTVDTDGPDPNTLYTYFADNGATFPWYGDTHEPALYVASTNTSWFAWETNFSNKRYVQVRTYNHTTGEWSPVYFAGLNSTLTDDDHGVPGLYQDHQGYVYCFYGSHANANDQQWAVTNSPNDPSAWTEKTPFTGFFTYPTFHAFADGTCLLFLRGGVTGSGGSEQDKYTLFTATGVTGGNPSWGAAVTLFELGDLPASSSRFYNGNHIKLSEDEVLIPFTQADNPNSYSRDVFAAVYNKTTAATRNLSSGFSTTTYPINIATTQANFRLVNQTGAGTYGTRVSITRDTSNNIHFIYGEAPAIAGPYVLKHRLWNGSLSAAVDVGEYATGGDEGHQTDRHAAVALPAGEIDAYWITASPFAHTWGGDVSKRRRSAAGVWGTPEVVGVATATYPLNAVTAVQNGHANARVVWCETVVATDWAATESNKLKCYAYGDNGFLTRPRPESEQGFQPLDYFGANVIAWWDLQAQGRLLNLSSTSMQWQDRAAGNLLTQSTAAMKPAYSATGWDGALPALTGDGLGPASTGDVLAGTGPYAATQSIFIVAERGTQNTETNTTLRTVYKTAVSSGGAVGYMTVLRPSADAGQTVYQVQGAGTGNVTVVSPTSFGIGAKAVLFGQIQTTDTRSAANSGALSSAGALGATTSTNTSLFGDSALTTGQRFGGKIVEVLIINRVLTTLERQYVDAYLAWKWGIQANLDASNPFKTTRPPALAA